ncbi:MAG: DNA alkylation repair protein [Chitinophagaceae bacterium]
MPDDLKTIRQLLQQHSSEAARAAHQKFVPGSREKVYGVRTPVLNELAARFKSGGFELAEALWKAGALEEKILAAKLVGRMAKKDPERALQLVRLFAQNIGNWAVCDTIGMQSLKPIVATHREAIFALARGYNRSADPWQRRLSLVLVEWYTRYKELHPAIQQLIQPLEKDPEYYVKKAVTWINKNFEKGK